MKVTVTVEIEGDSNIINFPIDVTDEAIDDIRYSHNPGLESVTRLKAMAAAYLSLMTSIRDKMKDAGIDAGREFAIARTDFQKVSMCAVLAATKGLKK